jgi:transcriptional regulator with XRE-family HTH domain
LSIVIEADAMMRMVREAEMFGDAMRRMRENRGLTQEALAHEAGITSSYAGQVERGQRVPSLTVILKIARALKVDAGELLSVFSYEATRRLKL